MDALPILPRTAVTHYNRQRLLARKTLREVRNLWRRVGYDFDSGWSLIAPELTALVADAMQEAARGGIDYLPRVLEETGQSAAGLLPVSASVFGQMTHDGRQLDSLLRHGIVVAKQAITLGHKPAGALFLGGKFLLKATRTEIADAAGDAVGASMITTHTVTGYVRMLNPPSCRRCVLLAGKWFRWNEGFDRHPQCDCVHIPAAESRAGDFTVDPYAYFDSLTPKEQDKAFGKRNAQAIRDGADIWRVENLKARGMMRTEGRNLGWNPPRLTLDEIYRKAGSNREAAISLLRQQGYITGAQTVGGNIGYGDLGLNSEMAHYLGAGTLGRGGTRKGATYIHRKAAGGIRNPLDRETMTAAERRLSDAHSIKQAIDAGRNPFMKGELTASQRRSAQLMWERELKKLRDGLHPKQVHELARLLGIFY